MSKISEIYIKEAIKTESRDFDTIMDRVDPLSSDNLPDIIRLIHASFGLNTEQAELQDALKKYIFYGKPLDKTNLIEEAGDLLWYLAILFDELGVSFDEVMELNIKKLARRYYQDNKSSKQFSEQRTIERNLGEERKALENEATYYDRTDFDPKQ